MKALSSLFLLYEKKRLKNVLAVAAIIFKNGVSKAVTNGLGVQIVATVLLLKTRWSLQIISLFGLKNG
jgi:hypothetical protein